MFQQFADATKQLSQLLPKHSNKPRRTRIPLHTTSLKPNTLPRPLQAPPPPNPILRPHLRLRPNPLQRLRPIQTARKHNNHSPERFRIGFFAQSRPAVCAESDCHREAGFVVRDGDFLERAGGGEGERRGGEHHGGGVRGAGEFAAVEAVAEGLRVWWYQCLVGEW